jgi:hypothetical protein
MRTLLYFSDQIEEIVSQRQVFLEYLGWFRHATDKHRSDKHRSANR